MHMAIRFTIFPTGNAGSPSVIVFDMEKILIGRGSICDLRLPLPGVSYHHATVEMDGARHTIRDESSTNGTTVNGERIPPDFKQVIRSDDVIEIGGFKIVPALSVPMEGAHSDERTERVARTLLRTTSDVRGPARLEVVEGPDAGLSIELGREGAEPIVLGGGEGCNVRLTDPDVKGMRVEVHHGIGGWTLVSDGEGQVPVRLVEGGTVEFGANHLAFHDPLEAYYATLLSSREDLEIPVAQAVQDADDEEDTEEDARQAPMKAGAELPPAPTVPPADETITSRTEVVGADGEQARMPEYSWIVVLLGIVSFLASLGLILLLIF
ncbi:MAG: FHA domain-containing protein [Deltaproteobacteria bacterium]|nr:FHA domain-containing protein [Deltaproteobacteria bacterium]